jgi:periplasmic protein TonB
MQNKNILSAPLIDLIFEGRNKEYGAYELRKSYAKRINKALFITTALAALAFGGAALASSLKKNERNFKMTEGVVLTEVPVEKEVEKIPELPKKTVEVQVKTVMFTAPTIVDKEEIQTPPPDMNNLTDAKIDVFTQDGVSDERIAGPETIGEGTGIIEKKVEKVPDEPFTTVEIDAKFSGNWKAFLERNLNPNTPTDNNAPEGSYSVMIQFVVDVNGNVSDIKPLTNHGYGLEQEAVRVLKKAAKWEPAIQNGIKVKAYRKQVITFQVLGE